MKGSAKALKSGRKYIWSILKWILMLAFAIYTLFPLLWLFITSFKTNAEYFDSPFHCRQCRSSAIILMQFLRRILVR